MSNSNSVQSGREARTHHSSSPEREDLVPILRISCQPVLCNNPSKDSYIMCSLVPIHLAQDLWCFCSHTIPVLSWLHAGQTRVASFVNITVCACNIFVVHAHLSHPMVFLINLNYSHTRRHKSESCERYTNGSAYFGVERIEANQPDGGDRVQ